jgi:hypothetical protein
MKYFRGLLRRLKYSGSGASPISPVWPRVRWTLRRSLMRIEWPGMLAIGILAICSAFYVLTIYPEQARLDRAHQSVELFNENRLQGSKLQNGLIPSPEAQLALFYQKFPAEGDASLWIGKLVALAASRGINLNDGEYKATRDKVGKLVRFQMTLPVNGTYLQIRKFLSDLQGTLPVIALENVQFERQKVADPKVEATIKLVLYLEQAS